ncbi:MAG TPA: AraC family ligand binding domain-containing protein [Candidatus Limnocylindrales bacterium]|nr:AraC family ligand binding domain-containing protein [Candidatus Limnocylindrales bacterium]
MPQLLLRTADRVRWTADTIPTKHVSSAGMFTVRGDGTATFDRHYHDFGEFWCIAAGAGILQIGQNSFEVQAGDVLYTPPGTVHDIVAVGEPMRIFWLSEPIPEGGRQGHQHQTPTDADKHPIPSMYDQGQAERS